MEIRPLHVGISVSDMERSLSWYESVLSFHRKSCEYIPPLAAVVAFLEKDGFELELFRCDERKDVNDGVNVSQDNRICGTKHLAFLTSDMEELKTYFSEKQVNIFLETQMGAEQVMFITDPDDTVIEFICRC